MWKGGGTTSAKDGYGGGNLGEVAGMEPRFVTPTNFGK